MANQLRHRSLKLKVGGLYPGPGFSRHYSSHFILILIISFYSFKLIYNNIIPSHCYNIQENTIDNDSGLIITTVRLGQVNSITLEAHCSFACYNEGTGCPTNRTTAAVLAIFIIHLTNQETGCQIKRTFVLVLTMFIP